MKDKIILVKLNIILAINPSSLAIFKLFGLAIFKFNLVMVKLFCCLHFFGDWSVKSGNIIFNLVMNTF